MLDILSESECGLCFCWSSTNVLLMMCSRPGLLYIWQGAVMMTNEDLCTRIRTAFLRQPCFTQANTWEQTLPRNAAQVLREQAEYRCIAAGSSQEFPEGMQVYLEATQTTYEHEIKRVTQIDLYKNIHNDNLFLFLIDKQGKWINQSCFRLKIHHVKVKSCTNNTLL